MKRIKFNGLLAMTLLTLVALGSSLVRQATVTAAVLPNAPTGQVSFTFDDGFSTFATKAAPALAAHNQKGTLYLSTGCVDGTGTCRQNVDPAAEYLTWDQVQTLKNTYGWEIGAHTANHPLMTEITPAQLEAEFTASNQAFAAHGLAPTAFATPYGDYNSSVVAAIARNYTSHRGFHDIGYNAWPANRYLLQVQQVQAGVSVATVKGYIDQAKANNTWLVLVFHDIQDNPSSDPEDYQFSTANLEAVAAYAQAQNIKNVNVTEGLTTGQSNLLPNSGFANGLGSGWKTNTPANVVANTAGNGAVASPANSVAMTAAADQNVYLFSPTINIDPTRRYWLSAYVNTVTRTSGEVAFYVDEYDTAGNWISGQYKQALTVPEFKDASFIYQPTSAQVKKASVQVIVTAGSGITTYIDNVEWYGLDAAADPDPNPTPTNLNLLPNSGFNNGVGDGWTTDNAAAIASDTANHGSPASPSHSVKLTAPASGNAHLFAPKVNVQSGTTYIVKAFLNILTLNTGEVAFYVDEYDTAGNWISGQYLFAKRNEGEEQVEFTYTPTSSNVARAQLQVILTGNSGINGYLDEVQFLAPQGTPPPVVDPPAPTPTTTVLETAFANGIADGWHTDTATAITADAAGNGAADEPQHSVKLVSGTANAQLFSPNVNVSVGTTYTLESYLNIVQLASGEVAFYVDEYDTAGNWISGQYLYARRTAGTVNVSFNYTPTSAAVAQASLQVILTGNSGITAYLDSIKWLSA
ncbi:MAG TPA: polysaccharide deacetylase family protein [Candidatus Limnocylindria bacterium]|nr:polysaccharide deacetylase family protein [Candidatus Limnocylindria bacterium]